MKSHLRDLAFAQLLIALSVNYAYSEEIHLSSNRSEGDERKPNVLFIAVDDLRPELNCFGATYMHTPNFDRLARMGVIFERAYCQQAVCAPSRNSLMTGLRPDAIGIYDLHAFFRTTVPDVITLPEHFKNNGYRTETVGKIYHRGHGNHDDARSWSVPGWNYGRIFHSTKPIASGNTTGLQGDYPKRDGKYLPFHCSDAPEDNMTDAIICRLAIDRIKALKNSSFFLAVGFIKPHLPFVSPRKFWDLYDPATIAVPSREKPKGMPNISLKDFTELRSYYGIPPAGPIDDNTARNLIRGYYAAVSMIDAQVGKLIDALEENGLIDKTVIVLWGDHGWKLGEYGSWCKHSNVELDTNAPLFVCVPWLTKGVRTKSLAEFVDIYPTLCDLANLAKPPHLEGQSLLPILEDPRKIVNKVALSQYPREMNVASDSVPGVMGYSLRTDKYRYTRWQKYEIPNRVIATELYDLASGNVATVNLAKKPEYEKVVKQMDELLDKELSKYKSRHAHRLRTAR